MLSVWAALTAADVAFVAAHGGDCPLVDDWPQLPKLFGDEPITLAWLLDLREEHHLAIPKLLIVASYRAFHDFRAVSYVSVGVLSATALVVVMGVWRLRGRPRIADVALPTLCLSLAHVDNWIGNGLCSQFILSTSLAMLLIPCLIRPSRVAVVVISLLLPLCGAGVGLRLGWHALDGSRAL